MKQRLNEILLIDDSEADNFIHARVIRKAKVTDKIVTKLGGKEALDYLAEKQDNSYPNPDLVFLDINMPGMNGWEFLEAYTKLPEEQKASIVVCMLTTSLASKDRDHSKNYEEIKAFHSKPLTQEMLMKVIGTFFPERI